MDRWWLCPSCRSVNPTAQVTCHGCGVRRDFGASPGPAVEAPSAPSVPSAPMSVPGSSPGRARRLVLTAVALVLAAALVALVAATAAGAFSNPQRRLADATVEMCAALRVASEAQSAAALSTCPIVARRAITKTWEAGQAADRWARELGSAQLSEDLAVRAAVFRAHVTEVLFSPGQYITACNSLAAALDATARR